MLMHIHTNRPHPGVPPPREPIPFNSISNHSKHGSHQRCTYAPCLSLLCTMYDGTHRALLRSRKARPSRPAGRRGPALGPAARTPTRWANRGVPRARASHSGPGGRRARRRARDIDHPGPAPATTLHIDRGGQTRFSAGALPQPPGAPAIDKPFIQKRQFARASVGPRLKMLGSREGCGGPRWEAAL